MISAAMERSCLSCARVFELRVEDVELLSRIGPRVGGVSIELPVPRLCPPCRAQRRLAWRNERSLYVRRCDSSGQTRVAMYQPETPFPVFTKNEWWGDGWDALSYGCDYDFSRSFFDQFAQLFKRVPRFSIYHMGQNENSDYCNYSLDNRRCYLSFSVTRSEDSLYVTGD